MATTEPMPRPAFTTDHLPSHAKSIPILSSTSSPTNRITSPPAISEPEPMDITPTNTTSMPPPATSSPPREAQSEKPISSDSDVPSATNGISNGHPASLGAAAAAQQPKVVQTAFIHKLYNMLEDQSIQHLISWSSSNDSFVMSPSQEFAKVLSQYFKHTNISSFVRQLNMYGFHKISDVFHNGAPDSTLWEFRHGNNSFKRGDIHGLREIKRRASRHTLINRDTFPPGPKSLAPAQPPNGPSEAAHDTSENRLANIEHYVVDMSQRLARAEDSLVYMTSKCQILSEGLLRCHQWNQDLATYLIAAVPDTDNHLHRDIAMMQREIARQTEMLRNAETPDPSPQEPRPTFAQPQLSFVSNHLQDSGPPLSPRQVPAMDATQRRPSQPSILEPRAQQPSSFRTPIAPHLSISPRRYGSIGSNNSSYSPSSARVPPPPPPSVAQPPTLHPLANVTSPPANLSRRHTSADIRLHGWQGGPPSGSAHPGSHLSAAWPPSPARDPVPDSALRQSLASYELPRGPSSQQKTPPRDPLDPLAAVAGTGPDSAWAVPGSRYPGFSKGFGNGLEGSGGPPTRRSSMASNLHGLLNPAGETVVEEPDSGDSGGGKRKRMI